MIPDVRAEDSPFSVTDAIEQSILALADPFVVKVKPEPEPEPVIKIVPQPKLAENILEPPKIQPEVVPTPAVAVVVEKVEAPKLKITGIMFSSDHSLAIVNGSILEPGESLENTDGKITIKKIEKEKLQIIYKKLPFTVPVDQGE